MERPVGLAAAVHRVHLEDRGVADREREQLPQVGLRPLEVAAEAFGGLLDLCDSAGLVVDSATAAASEEAEPRKKTREIEQITVTARKVEETLQEAFEGVKIKRASESEIVITNSKVEM